MNELLLKFPPILLGQDEEAAAMAVVMVMMVVMLIAMVIGIAIAIMILLFLQRCFERIPPQFRETEPWQVWLLLIPGFGIIWIFFIYPKLAQAYQRYFYAQGRTDVGDCGYQLALWYCILTCCSIIPYIGAIPGMAALVIWIIFLLKAKELRDQIPPGGGFTGYAQQPQVPMQKPTGWG